MKENIAVLIGCSAVPLAMMFLLSEMQTAMTLTLIYGLVVMVAQLVNDFEAIQEHSNE